MTGPSILAFDTSAAHCAAALLCYDQIVASRYVPMTRGQAESLMPLLEEVMEEQAMPWDGLDAIGVGIGPGNFTGIRIAVSAARGLAMGLGIPAIGISAFDILRGPTGPTDVAPQRVVLQSQRAGLYIQDYVNGRPAAPPQPGANGYAGWADVPAPDAGFAIVGRHATDIAARWAVKGIDATLPDTGIADTIARIAATRLAQGGPATPPAPLYLRPADAAPSRDVPPVLLDG
ncbi:tRNA (adenosine(37)-N6)-threonylcarbamoyltransferase complex dimerization subunit type 1 TsaB [Chachezhania antarctica]|uniref:tRNA (adenosine(37)-N6)-threonylcarbamoyltransferase complex dimerization subunit type 1 TsaB n=1 Tax=Chachezhania antarctica TaxID=2340860 RepID=UPI000EB0F445